MAEIEIRGIKKKTTYNNVFSTIVSKSCQLRQYQPLAFTKKETRNGTKTKLCGQE